MIFFVIFIFVSDNMWHFYVDVFFLCVLFWFRKKTGHVDVERDFWVLNGCYGRSGDEGWWLVLFGWVDLHILGVAETSLHIYIYVYIYIREGLATYIIPESSFFYLLGSVKWCGMCFYLFFLWCGTFYRYSKKPSFHGLQRPSKHKNPWLWQLWQDLRLGIEHFVKCLGPELFCLVGTTFRS